MGNSNSEELTSQLSVLVENFLTEEFKKQDYNGKLKHDLAKDITDSFINNIAEWIFNLPCDKNLTNGFSKMQIDAMLSDMSTVLLFYEFSVESISELIEGFEKTLFEQNKNIKKKLCNKKIETQYFRELTQKILKKHYINKGTKNELDDSISLLYDVMILGKNKQIDYNKIIQNVEKKIKNLF